MSTIGTTLKQPRVFAHDAVALSALCGNISGIIVAPAAAGTIDPLAGDVAGTGYTVGAGYATTTNGGGSGAIVDVLTVGGILLEVITFDITTAGINYEVGDVLTVIDGNDDCQIVVTETGCSTWALGDPITQMPNEALGSMNSVPYWNEKMAYTYELGAGHPNPGPHTTPGPGAALYIASAMDITVVMESGNIAEFAGVAAGSFLPVSVLSVSVATPLEDVLALF